MIHLSQMLGRPVVDSAGERIGTISDVAIATGEVFPRVTSLAFLGPDKTPYMLSWRKYVAEFEADSITLNAAGHDLRFSYLQDDEVLLYRDLLGKQIVDTQGMKVVRVNDLKLSESRNQLRLLGAEVGLRGRLRATSPLLERTIARVATMFGHQLSESLIAWNYMDLLDRDLSTVKLSVTHKRLHELHPADIADILEELEPAQRALVFSHLDNEAAAETISALEDEYQAGVIDDLSERRASDLLAQMDPDDAADVIGDLPYEKAERLLRLMGVKDASAIRGLLGYRDKTAGGLMTPEVTTVSDEMTVAQVIEHLRAVAEESETIYYVYVVEGERKLTGVVSLRDLLLAKPDTTVDELAVRDLFTSHPDDDQELVAEQMSRYDLLALPVVDEHGQLLGIVTVDDALDVLEEEAEEDLALATGTPRERTGAHALWWWIARRGVWAVIWIVVFFGVNLARLWVDTLPDAPEWLWYGMGYASMAAILMPLLLRTGEESSSRAVAELIAGADEEGRPSLMRRLLTEGAAGLTVSVLAGLVAFGILALETGDWVVALIFAFATALSLLLTVILGGFVAEAALRRGDAGKPVSSTALATLSMTLAAAVYLTLSLAGGWVLLAVG